MNPLARLIQRRKTELDLTWQEIARRGGFSHHTVVYQLANKPVHKQPPRIETLQRLAKALDVPLDVVRQAALDAAGLKVEVVRVSLEAAEDVRIVAAVMDELSPRDREILRGIAEQFARSQRESRGSKDGP